MLLSQYITQVRRLLNDSQRNYWPDQELTDYINEARMRVVVDTICCRKFQIANLVPNQEQYQYTDPVLALPLGNQTLDIINVTAIWGTSRIPLGYLDFTMFSAKFRPWINYQRVPVCYSIYNASEFWIAYMPDTNYTCEFDTLIKPLPLVSDDSVDIIPEPYSFAVRHWAAMLARWRIQQYSEAEAQQKFYDQMIARLGAMPPRRIPYMFPNDIF